MPVHTEYSRTFQPFTTSPKSPVPPIPAGLSSAKMGVTQEPPVGMKKKPKHPNAKVNFLSENRESESRPTEEENKGLKFKAGFRRPKTIISTEYQREFNWPDPAPPDTPFLEAPHSTYNTHTHNNKERSPQTADGYNHDQTEQDRFQYSHAPNPKTHAVNQPANSSPIRLADKSIKETGVVVPSTASKANLKQKNSPKKPDKSHNHHRPIHGQKQRQFIQDLMSKQTSGKDDKKALRSKKIHKKMVKRFVTEYQRQFGKSSVKTDKTKKNGDLSIPPGMPRMLTDPSDPRLLKHSPLPSDTAPDIQPNGGWVTDYSVNFTPPTDMEHVGPVLRDHSEPGFKPTEMPTEEGGLSEHPLPPSHSWYDQLVELRERAERYKKRAEGGTIRRLLPLTRHDLAYRCDSASSSSHTLTSSPTPSDSVSCTYSDCPHHVKSDTRPSPVRPLASPVLNEPAHPSSYGGMEVQDIEGENDEVAHQKLSFFPGAKPHPPPVIPQPTPLEADKDSGRIQTPVIQKSSSDFRRHHLDRTTPMAGGLFISPPPQKQQSPQVVLPYPPRSPKFRRDMRSSAPISPAPKNTRDECVQVDVSSSQASGISSSLSVGAGPSTKLPHSVPVSSSPYHTRCVPVSKSKSGSIRKLDFKSSQTKVTSSKTAPKPYSYRVQGLTSAAQTDCNICGAHLKPALPVPNNVGSTFVPSTTSKAHTTQNGYSTSSDPSRPRVSVMSSQPHTSHRPHSSTNYMTRLPSHIENRPREFDESSLASLSLSSCSVASDILRKAQERKDHFWNQPTRVTAT